MNDRSYELAHDSLAGKIFEKIGSDEKLQLEVRTFLEQAYRNYKRRGVLLGKKDLAYVAPHVEKMNLPEEVEGFYQKSRRTVRKRQIGSIAFRGCAFLLISGLALFTGVFFLFTYFLGNQVETQTNAFKSIYKTEIIQDINQGIYHIKEGRYSLETKIGRFKIGSPEAGRAFYKAFIRILPPHYQLFYSRKIELDTTASIGMVRISQDGQYVLCVYQGLQPAEIYSLTGKPVSILNDFVALGNTNSMHNDVSAAIYADSQLSVIGATLGRAGLWNEDGRLEKMLSGEHEHNFVTFSNTGKYIATASWDGTARIFSRTGHLLRVLKGHGADVGTARFSPNGRFLVTSSFDKTAKIWTVERQLLHTLTGHRKGLDDALFSPDGQYILTISRDRTVRAWDTNGRLLAVLDGHKDEITKAVFSPDSRYILTASRDETAILWEINGKKVKEIKEHNQPVHWVSFSPDNQHFLTCSTEQALVWSIDGHKVGTIAGHKSYILQALFSPDGREIVSFAKDGWRIWPFAKHITPGMLFNALELYRQPYFSFEESPFQFSSDDSLILGRDGKLAKLWDLNGKTMATFQIDEDSIFHADFSPDGGHVLTLSTDSTARLWDLNGRLMGRYQDQSGLITSSTISPQNCYVFTISNNSQNSSIWDVEKGTAVTIAKPKLRSACFSPDEQWVAGIHSDSIVGIWDMQGNLIKEIRDNNEKISHIDISRDSAYLLIAGKQGMLKVCDKDGRLVVSLKKNRESNTPSFRKKISGTYRIAQFSKNGWRIITIDLDNIIRIWDLEGKLLLTHNVNNIDFVAKLKLRDSMRVLRFFNTEDTSSFWWAPRFEDNARSIEITKIGRNIRIGSGGYLLDEYLPYAFGDNPGEEYILLSHNGKYLLTHSYKTGQARLWPLDPELFFERLERLGAEEFVQ